MGERGMGLGLVEEVELAFGGVVDLELFKDDLGFEFVDVEPEVEEGFVFGGVGGEDFEGDFEGFHEEGVGDEVGVFEEAADGGEGLFFGVEGEDGVEAVDEVGGVGVKFFVVEGEGAFFEALLGGEEFAGSAGGVDEFMGFGEFGDVEAAYGEGELSGFVEGEFAGVEGIPGEEIPLGEGVEAGGFGLDEFAEAVVGYGNPGLGEGFLGADFLAVAVEDGVLAGEDVEGGAEGAEVEVDAGDVVGFKFGGALFDEVGELGAEVVPPGGAGVGVAFAADEEDGAGDAIFFGLVEVLGVFGVDGPGGGDFKSGVDEGGGEGVPCAGFFMVKLDGHYAVVAEDAVVFLEGHLHFGFVVLVGEFVGADAHIPKAGGVSDGFAVFVGEFVNE